MVKIIVLLFALACVVSSLPLETPVLSNGFTAEAVPKASAQPSHTLRRRRFINPLFSLGRDDIDDIVKIRLRRSYEECEKLRLCKLHARSHRSFFAAYELYFVNKENARLWDHQERSMEDCERRYGNCYDRSTIY